MLKASGNPEEADLEGNSVAYTEDKKNLTAFLTVLHFVNKLMTTLSRVCRTKLLTLWYCNSST